MYPYIKQNIYIHTSVYSIPDLWSQRIIFHYWNGFCKAQISSHPEEATYSDLFSCSIPNPDLLQNDAQIVWLPTLFQWQIFHRLLYSTSLCFSLPINTIRIMMEPIRGLARRVAKITNILSHSENVFHKLKKKKNTPLSGCIMKALHFTAFVLS